MSIHGPLLRRRELFRRRETWRENSRHRRGSTRGCKTRRAEIDQLGPAVDADDDVAGLDIAAKEAC